MTPDELKIYRSSKKVRLGDIQRHTLVRAITILNYENKVGPLGPVKILQVIRAINEIAEIQDRTNTQWGIKHDDKEQDKC
jgi:hypothetical protein